MPCGMMPIHVNKKAHTHGVYALSTSVSNLFILDLAY
jgi:hypothetical protein